MSATSVVFLLMLITGGGGPISITQIGEFKTKATCTTAQEVVQKAVGLKAGTKLVCVSDSSLEDSEAANR